MRRERTLLVRAEGDIIARMPKALIIDSEAPVAAALKDALAARGVDSIITADGTDGLDRVKAEKPDLIVLCVELSRGSGYSVCNKLKKDPDMAAIPLILTSSQATEETFEQHKKLRTRAEAYVKKPYEMDFIMDTIGKYVTLGEATHSPSDEVEVSIDELEVELPHAPAVTPAKKAAVAADEEFLDVSFDGEEPEPEVSRPRADTQVSLATAFPPESSVTDVLESPITRAPGPITAVRSSGTSEAELNRLRDEVKTLRARNQKLEQEAQEKEVAFNDRLLQESARGRDALDAKKKLAQIERDVAKYQQAATKSQADAETAQAQLRELQAQNEGIGNERGALTDKIAQLVDKVKELAAERDTLQRQVAEAQEAQRNASAGSETADKMKEKARKAVDIAMQLLEETRLAH